MNREIRDNVFIMYHRKSDNTPLFSTPPNWNNLQNGGETADGVAVVEGGKLLVVAPTESPTPLNWSSDIVDGGGTSTTDRLIALNDWKGKANTASQVAHPECSGANYAPGFCNQYSHGGLGAGKWWLPSVGELTFIASNKNKINYALSLISGATQLNSGAYWASTEGGSIRAWNIYMNSVAIDYYITKNTAKYLVRAVSEYIK